eukprot:TRINITY_DN3002_c0_g1_i1.p1 TRINITY_DN3002_c0_g1~~TRINITY_DN3002_c0_g1_i1.p1  ORF type:complete len:204 (+),score=42.64 TRINITY_DN3002_c0_g1_i1:70-612(+)
MSGKKGNNGGAKSAGWDLPSWAYWWFYISFPIVIWDASYVLTRPHSMHGGSLNAIFSPYELYITADRRYADITDGFVIGQSWLNLIEVLLGVFACLRRGTPSALVLGYSSALMSLAKTILYFMCEFLGGFKYTGGTDLQTFITLFFIPSFFWVLFPGLIVWSGYNRLTRGLALGWNSKTN